MSQYNGKPTRSVALKYSPDKSSSPVVVAAGMGYVAEKIVETAIKHDIPVYEDDSLANILSQLNEGSEIPTELFQAVADLYVYFLGFAKEGGDAPAENASQNEDKSENEPASQTPEKEDVPLQEN